VAHYLDTSALVKLVVAELETDALIAWLNETNSDWVSSDLTRTELMRAVRRTTPDRVVRAREVLDSITLLNVTTQIYEEAARGHPPPLRPLATLDQGPTKLGLRPQSSYRFRAISFQRKSTLLLLCCIYLCQQ